MADVDDDEGEWTDVEEEDEDLPKLYRDDVVSSSTCVDRVGMVLTVSGGVPDDEEDEEEMDLLPDGHALVQWLGRADPRPEKIQGLLIEDRTFIPGDTVARVSDDFSGTKGTVVGMQIICTLKSVSGGKVIQGISSQRLLPIHRFSPGMLAVHHPTSAAPTADAESPRNADEWLGRVEHVEWNVTVCFPDESECVVHSADPDKLVPVDARDILYSDLPVYYPCMRVGCSEKVWTHAGKQQNKGEHTHIQDQERTEQWVQWTKGSFNRSLRRKGVVASVEPAR